MKKIIQASLVTASLTLFAIPAMADVVIVVNPKNPLANMTPEQVAQYFLGKSTTFTPLDQPENSAIRAEFYKKVADKEPSQVKAIWSKLVFTGKGTLPKEYGSSAEVKKAVASDLNAIGYIEKSSVDVTVKVIAN
ncbi:MULTISPECIES: hypothetical protein [unclassified Undibacterium]|uniref:hypothetical protein n=1 Tax=unclassified Undibacterium TaxID=2630295 RepID=UPI0033946CAB